MKNIFQASLLIGFLFLSIQSAYSCGCLPMTFQQQVARTGYVFVGKVVQIKEDTSIKRQPYESRRYFVKLKIGEKFKGVKTDEITLVQYEDKGVGMSSCPDWNLVMKETYLIYANKTGKDIHHEVACSPTQRFDANSPDYKELLSYKAKKLKENNRKKNYIKL